MGGVARTHDTGTAAGASQHSAASKPERRVRTEVLLEWRDAPRVLRGLVVAQILVIVVLGMLIATHYTPWSALDERQHYDYVEYIAQDGRLPVLGKDRIHSEAASIGSGTYPAPAPIPKGFAGESYEAFQPPLYYLAVAPAWFLTPNHLHKVGVLRAVGLLFLLLTIPVLAALCRLVVGKGWPFALAFALLIFIAPGFLFRSVTIGNAALEPLVVTSFIVCAVVAWKRTSYPWLIATAAALGTCLLTRLTLGYLLVILTIVAVAVWWRRGHRARQLGWLTLVGLTPPLMLAPWLAFNRAHYHGWTAASLARSMQEPIVNPGHVSYTVWSSVSSVPSLLDFTVPQEWHPFVAAHSFADLALTGLRVVVIPLAILLLVVFGRRAIRGGSSLICLTPLPLAWIALIISTASNDWPQLLSRYTFGALPAFAVVAYSAYRLALPRARDYSVFVVLLTATTTFALVQLCWTAFIEGNWEVV